MLVIRALAGSATLCLENDHLYDAGADNVRLFL